MLLRTFAVVLMVLGALAVAACSESVLSTSVRSANALARSAETTEALLTSTCRVAELAAVQDASSDDDAAARAAVIQAQCARAWDAYNRFRTDWLELSLAIEAAKKDPEDPNVVNIVELIARVVDDERRFVDAVREIVGQYGAAS